MMYLVEHPELILLFSSVPFLAWLIRHYLNPKVVTVILCIGIILLAPAVTGYSYVVDSAYGLLLYLIASCSYSFIVRGSQKEFLSVVLPSIILLPVLGVITSFVVMIGTINVEKEWELNGYKVRYMHDQGFSGRPLLIYELYEYGSIPIFIKNVDAKVDDDTTNNCTVKFEYKHITFNKCLPK